MTTKSKVILAAVALLTAFAFGRYTVPEKVITVTKTVEVEKKTNTTDTDTDRNKHQKTTIVEVTHPDGTKEKTTTITQDTETHKTTDSKTDESSTKDSTQTSEVVRGSQKVTVSALAGFKFTSLMDPPVFGVSISKPLFGPITVGAFGLTNGLGGVSVGLTF